MNGDNRHTNLPIAQLPEKDRQHVRLNHADPSFELSDGLAWFADEHQYSPALSSTRIQPKETVACNPENDEHSFVRSREQQRRSEEQLPCFVASKETNVEVGAFYAGEERCEEAFSVTTSEPSVSRGRKGDEAGEMESSEESRSRSAEKERFPKHLLRVFLVLVVVISSLLVGFGMMVRRQNLRSAADVDFPSPSPSSDSLSSSWEEILQFSPEDFGLPSEQASVAFGGSHRLAVASTHDGGTVQVYDTSSGHGDPVGRTITMRVTNLSRVSVKMTDDGTRLAIAALSTETGYIRVYDYEQISDDWALATEWRGERAGDGIGSSMDMSADGQRLAFVDASGTRARAYSLPPDQKALATPFQLGPDMFFNTVDQSAVVTISEDLLGMGDTDGVQYYSYKAGERAWIPLSTCEMNDDPHHIDGIGNCIQPNGPEHGIGPGVAIALTDGRSSATFYKQYYYEFLMQEVVSINLGEPVQQDDYVSLTAGRAFHGAILIWNSQVSVFEYSKALKRYPFWKWDSRGSPLPLDKGKDGVPIAVAVYESDQAVLVASLGSDSVIRIFQYELQVHS